MNKKSMSEVTSLFAEGFALHQAGRLEEAEKIYCKILATQPDHFDSLHWLGVSFYQRGNHAEAVSQIDFALQRDPNNVFALNNHGIALHELKRFEEALASYDRALTLRPDFAETLSNRGNLLRQLKRVEEALASYDRTPPLRPDCGQTHCCEALCRLLMGDFDRGWAKFQCRRKRKLAQPEWLGSCEIGGKAILLHAEESLGDTIQFCRYVPLVAERAA